MLIAFCRNNKASVGPPPPDWMHFCLVKGFVFRSAADENIVELQRDALSPIALHANFLCKMVVRGRKSGNKNTPLKISLDPEFSHWRRGRLASLSS